MDNTNPEYVDFNIICSDDCGNAPKKIFLKEFTVAFANNDMVFITENITDSFHWNIIGKKSIQGKEKFVENLKEMKNSKVTELNIRNIITHGNTGSVNGTIILENKKSYAFCDVYNFTSTSKNSKIKKLTSYVIEIS